MAKTVAMLDKELFYQHLKKFSNKHMPIFFDMPINSQTLHIRLIFSWQSRKPNGDFNPTMFAQLIDMTLTVTNGKYITPDLCFDCIKEGITTDFKLYKYLNAWIKKALEQKEEKQ